MPIRAVLTGDIINSKEINDKSHLISVLKEIFIDNQNLFSFQNPFEIFRGDSFQAILKKPNDALRVCLLIKSGLIAKSPENQLWDARISIGISTVDFTNIDVKIANGKAFELSGEGLDAIKQKDVGLAILTDRKQLNSTLETINTLTDTILKRWRKNAAEVVYLSLLYKFTQKEIALKLNISQSAVQQRFASAHFDAVYSYIRYFENELKF